MPFTRLQTKSVTAQDTFTTAIAFGGSGHSDFNWSVSGTWAATVTLQRSFDGGSTFVDVETTTVNLEKRIKEVEDGVFYRVGVKTGEFTSGTVVLRLSESF